MKDALKTFLNNYKEQEITLVLNPGNLGDALISLGTYQLFKDLGLKYKVFQPNSRSVLKNKNIFYSGGGNLVMEYPFLRSFLERNHKDNNIVILPHTINSCDKLLQSLGDNVKIFAREKETFKYISKHLQNKENAFLSKDLAFYIRTIPDLKSNIQEDYCNIFREDSEKTSLNIPKGNKDIPWKLLRQPPFWGKNAHHSQYASDRIFNYLAKYKNIYTNRLHIAIAGALMNKNVKLYPNSYYKNKAVYDYSIKAKFKKVKFIDQKDGDIKQ